MVNSSLSDSGWGPQLLCSVFGLAPLQDPDTAPDADTDSGPVPGPTESPAPKGAVSGTATPVGAPADDPALTSAALDVGPRSCRPSPDRAGCSPPPPISVYLFKRGTFYPFIPDGHEHRDTEEELKLKSLVADDLVVETDLDRWFPLWDLPVG